MSHLKYLCLSCNRECEEENLKLSNDGDFTLHSFIKMRV